MFPVLEIGQSVLLNFSFFIIHPIFWVVMGLILLQYNRIRQMEERLFGQPYNQIWDQVLPSVLLGVGGGLLASFILVILGFSLDQVGIPLMLGFAFLLLLINPRFLCFAYSIGILALVVFLSRGLVFLFPELADNVVFSSLVDIYLPNLLVLVAVLHLTEALLIYLGGHWGSTPVFFRSPRGNMTGGFTLQRFWPVPLVIMVALVEPEATTMPTVSMPDWWPILEPHLDPGPGKMLIYTLLPVAAALGYGDMALSSSPREKSIASAKYLALYSIVLLLLALAAVMHHSLLLLAVIFSPLGHEAVVHLGHQRELKMQPRYAPPPDYGVKVLAVFPDSPAERAGLQSEDLIREVNRNRVEHSRHFWQLLWEGHFWVHLRVERGSQEITMALERNIRQNLTVHRFPFKKKMRPFPAKSLGLVLVPEEDAPVFVELKSGSPLDKIKERFFQRR